MAISITIRDVPNETRDELARRAALRGQSLQEFLTATLVRLAAQPDPVVLMDRVRRRKELVPTSVPADIILGYRDADRT